MIFVLLIFAFLLEPFFDSCQDLLETEISFKKSIFSKLNPEFWCKPISAHAVKLTKGTGYRFDGWHGAKSCQIISFAVVICLLVVFKIELIERLHAFVAQFHIVLQILFFLAVLACYGLIRNKSFSLFYEKILTRKDVSRNT